MIEMKVGSLFSGIGGFDLGLERAGCEIIWQVENNEYCRRVLRKHWPSVPCHGDITVIDWRDIPAVDLVCGGFPCQPFSCAGKQRGAADDRYLWPEVVRCLSILRPTWFLGENVPGLLHLGIDQVLSDLEALGYQTSVLGIPACGVDAPHRRDRLWIVGWHANDWRCSRNGWKEREIQEQNSISARNIHHVAHAARLQPGRKESWPIGERTGECSESINVADAKECGLEREREQSTGDTERSRQVKPVGRRSANNGRWLPEPAVGRVAHGIPHRVDRLKGLGNAIVPQIAEALGMMIMEVEKQL
jgi:DNA (cytosine-5)-methyltransferase 1